MRAWWCTVMSVIYECLHLLLSHTSVSIHYPYLTLFLSLSLYVCCITCLCLYNKQPLLHILCLLCAAAITSSYTIYRLTWALCMQGPSSAFTLTSCLPQSRMAGATNALIFQCVWIRDNTFVMVPLLTVIIGNHGTVIAFWHFTRTVCRNKNVFPLCSFHCSCYWEGSKLPFQALADRWDGLSQAYTQSVALP